MGVDPFTAIAIGTAIAGATTTAVAAREQNRAVGRSQDASRRAALVQAQQLRKQAAQERTLREREAARVRGLLRVRGAAAGTGAGSSFESLIESADAELQEDLGTIDENLRMLLSRVGSGLDVNLTELASRQRSAVLDGIGGGISGTQSGLSIGSGIRELNAA